MEPNVIGNELESSLQRVLFSAASEVEGTRISELSGTQKVDLDSKFIISRKNGNDYESMYLTYDTLVQQISRDMSGLIRLGSMAFCDADSFSTLDHKHPEYNYMACIPMFKPEDYEDKRKISCMFTVLTSNSEGSDVVSVLYPPTLNLNPSPTPYIGEIKTVAINGGLTKNDIKRSIEEGTFDGWVFADGASYSRTTAQYDFSEAYEFFGGSGNKFAVPYLSDFFVASTESLGSKQVHVSYQIGCPQHVHSITPNSYHISNHKITCDVSIVGGGKQYGHEAAEQGKEKGLHLNYMMKTKQDMFVEPQQIYISGLKTQASNTNSSQSIRETVPNHHKLPTMVYIGMKKRINQ